MKDLDFDELDRAVNSLMTNVPKSEPQADGTPEKTLDIPSTSGDGDELSFDKVTEAAKKVADEAPKTDTTEKPVVSPNPEPRASAVAQHASNSVRSTAPAPANRRGGRFMDVVHPSADMSKPDSPKPISRQGLNLEPLNSSSQKIADVVPQKKDVAETAPKTVVSVEESTPEEKPVTATSVPQEPAKTATSDEPTSESKPTSDWPDPLDMMTSEPEKKEETPPEPEMPQVEAEPETSAPLTSPFLPDAKVEKRPLGGTATEDDAPIEEDAISRAPMADDIKKSVDDPNKQLPANPTEVEQVLPEELSGDLMAVEADTTHAELKRAHDENQAPSSPVTAEKPATAQDFEPKEPSTKPAAPAEEVTVPAGPTSIPQQYKEEPSTGDQDNGSIYDTDTYHQPLAHPAKKKSGWMWVVWIALILAVGAGGGALLYILKLV